MKEIKINKNKRIGKVIYFVEGDVTEVEILSHLFHTILNYEVVSYDKRIDRIIKLTSKTDKYSTVYLIPMKYSAINKIFTSQDYIDAIYKKMKDNDLLIINSFKYFIFDRDRNNNRPGAILKAIDIFKIL